MNNAVFGETMEIVGKHVNVKLVRTLDKDKIKKYIAKPTFERIEIFNKDLVGIQHNKTNVLSNKPIYIYIYVGMRVLYICQ